MRFMLNAAEMQQRDILVLGVEAVAVDDLRLLLVLNVLVSLHDLNLHMQTREGGMVVNYRWALVYNQ